MADIAGLAIGSTTAAMSAVRFLVTWIENVKDAPKSLKNLVSELETIEGPLTELKKAQQGELSDMVLGTQIVKATEKCKDVCEEFKPVLQDWMKRSTEDKTFWFDRWKVGLLGETRIRVFHENLTRCQSTLQTLIGASNVITVARSSNMMSDMMKDQKNSMLQLQEASVKEAMKTQESRQARLENSLRGILLECEENRAAESKSGRLELLQAYQSQQESNKIFWDGCKEALANIVSERTGVKIKLTEQKVSDNATAVIGLNEASGQEVLKMNVDVDISKTTVEGHAKAYIGWNRGMSTA